jgi:TonB family protein
MISRVTRRTQLFTAIFSSALVTLCAQADVSPARYLSGPLPPIPVLAVSGGEVLLSVNVTAAGAVGSIDVLRNTPPFTEAVLKAVRSWRFAPAADPMHKPIASKVFVGAVFRPPTIDTPTLGEPPKDAPPVTTGLPLPLSTAAPGYPPRAQFDGVVLVETQVGSNGKVVGVTAVRSSPPFDAPAMDAARAWVFRPAQGPGLPTTTFAYLLFGFRQPVTSAK